jgi:hypothetical protein
MSLEIQYLGTYTVEVPPNKRGVELITLLVEVGEEYAQEDGYTMAAVVPMKRGKGEDTIDIQVYVYEE